MLDLISTILFDKPASEVFVLGRPLQPRGINFALK